MPTASPITPTASWRPIMREGYSELVQRFYCRTERGCEFVKLRYRRWLWWTMFGMVITVLQFVLTLYLMCIIMKDFSARGSSEKCFSARQMRKTNADARKKRSPPTVRYARPRKSFFPPSQVEVESTNFFLPPKSEIASLYWPQYSLKVSGSPCTLKIVSELEITKSMSSQSLSHFCWIRDPSSVQLSAILGLAIVCSYYDMRDPSRVVSLICMPDVSLAIVPSVCCDTKN